MLHMLEPTGRALEATDCPILRLTGEAMKPGISAMEGWQQTCAARNRWRCGIDALTREDRQALDRLFTHLGESGREQQGLLLDQTIQKLEGFLTAAESKASESEKLYGSLGLLLGLMLALIVV